MTIYWREENQPGDSISLMHYVEENSKSLKSRYLSFIAGLGEVCINQKPLVLHLESKHGYSLWWMSLIAEHSFYKSPHILDCLKLVAIEDILKKNNPRELEF